MSSLPPEELEEIRRRLGREPSEIELGMFDVMWSEHCSYKSSKKVLKMLPTKAPYVIVGPGQDAGMVEIGDGIVIAMKIESHNHPSAIEPYNGAATGVGGIVRDILCMGAKPIALLDSLRFGNPAKSHVKWLVKGVVSGIADYGNCIGVPTVAGDVEFDDSFERNCLVNVCCIGVCRKESIVPSIARNPGDLVIVVGNTTGRDGLHGASFASKTLTEESEEERSAVQVGNPFMEKLLIDATIEAIKTGYVTGLKDLGGGGLTCALTEMSTAGNVGMDVDISKLHLREPLTPYEILLSESQERMLFIVDPRGVEKVTAVFDKYGLQYSIIGKVTKERKLIVRFKGKIIVEIDPAHIVKAPVLDREARKPSYISEVQAPVKYKAPKFSDLPEIILRLLSSPNIASKEWVYRQYDHEVGVRTVVRPGEGDAAVLRIFEEKLGVAIKSDCNSHHMYLDPYMGCMEAAAEACRNVACVGGRPIAVVDGCNFGNPENPEIFWQFREAIRGLSDFLREFDIPCIGGNVSFYNEDEVTGKAVKPTVMVVALGVVKDVEKAKTMSLKGDGNFILVIGETLNELGGSEYLRVIHGIHHGKPPTVDPKLEKRTVNCILELIDRNLVEAVHDCSHGGLAIALAEMCIKGAKGAMIDIAKVPARCESFDQILFSETNARVIIEVAPSKLKDVENILNIYKLKYAAIGKVCSDKCFKLSFNGKVAEIGIDEMKDAYSKALEKTLFTKG